MKNLLILFTLLMAMACSRHSGDDENDTSSDADSDTDSDTDTDTDTDTDSDTDTDTDTDTDSDTSGWQYDGPKQTSMGTAELTCDETDFSTDCASNAPSPCIPDGGKILCDLVIVDGDNAEMYNGIVGIERWGRSAGKYDKPNYELEFRLADGTTENPAPVLGMGKEEDWYLDGSWTDRSFMRSDLVFDLFKRLDSEGHTVADSRYVVLSVNSESRGIYRVVEKLKRDNDRVAIEKDDGSGSNFIVKRDNDGAMSAAMNGEILPWGNIYPTESKVTITQGTAIQAWLQEMATALDSGDGFDHLNMRNTVDWVLINEFAKNIRTFDEGFYLYKSQGETARLIPWDMDLSFGQPIATGSNESAEGWVPHNSLTANLLKDDAFATTLSTRWAELRKGPLLEASLTTYLDDYLAVLSSSAIDSNFAIWPMADLDLSVIEDEYSTPSQADFDAEVSALRSWISSRLTWIDENIDDYQ